MDVVSTHIPKDDVGVLRNMGKPSIFFTNLYQTHTVFDFLSF